MPPICQGGLPTSLVLSSVSDPTHVLVQAIQVGDVESDLGDLTISSHSTVRDFGVPGSRPMEVKLFGLPFPRGDLRSRVQGFDDQVDPDLIIWYSLPARDVSQGLDAQLAEVGREAGERVAHEEASRVTDEARRASEAAAATQQLADSAAALEAASHAALLAKSRSLVRTKFIRRPAAAAPVSPAGVHSVTVASPQSPSHL